MKTIAELQAIRDKAREKMAVREVILSWYCLQFCCPQR